MRHPGELKASSCSVRSHGPPFTFSDSSMKQQKGNPVSCNSGI